MPTHPLKVGGTHILKSSPPVILQQTPAKYNKQQSLK